MTTYRESSTGLLVPPSSVHLSEASVEYQLMVELYESRIGQLELQLQEQGWMRLGDSNGREFSRDALGQIVELARVNYLKNPLIQRAVEIGALYVWGQDLSLSITDEDVQAVVERFWELNQDTLTGQQASRLLEVERSVTGNLFLALFPDRVTGDVRVRQVPFEEVQEIIVNPEDRAEVWYYRREWSQRNADGTGHEQRAELHPDWRYRPAQRPDTMEWQGKTLTIRWDVPLIHERSGAFAHWRWGVPEIYAALDWAKAYKELLEDDATRSRALAKFAWKLSTNGGKSSVAAAKTRMSSTLGGGTGETNPPPVAGSTFIAGQGADLDPIKIAGATLPPDHSRPVRLMVASASGLSDTLLSGDVDQSSLATATSLDRPTELGFSEKRNQRVELLTKLIQWVINRDIEASAGMLRFTPTAEAREVNLTFPDLLEKSVTDRVAAVVAAATLDGKPAAGTIAPDTVSRLLLTALNVEDIDAELEHLASDEGGAPIWAGVAGLANAGLLVDTPELRAALHKAAGLPVPTTAEIKKQMDADELELKVNFGQFPQDYRKPPGKDDPEPDQ